MAEITGHLHPLTAAINRLADYFQSQGFEILEGPEMETEENNFTKLNIPANHPARDEQDTFYLDNGLLLRTHTTPMQIRAMLDRQVPVRLVFPGRVYRNEATDATHNSTFHQFDGVVIGPDINFRQLIGTLEEMVNHAFGGKMAFRVRPSYFPFVEPGLEVDIRQSKDQIWTELLGAGMIHPNVLAAMKIDSSRYQGFAFGMGLERLIKVITGLQDIRTLINSDYRLLGQF